MRLVEPRRYARPRPGRTRAAARWPATAGGQGRSRVEDRVESRVESRVERRVETAGLSTR